MTIDLSMIGALSAFGAGTISFLSPCVLPLVPGYVSFIGGSEISKQQEIHKSAIRKNFETAALSFCFVLGFSTVFIAFGASASWLGQWLNAYRFETNLIGGVIIILFGIAISGLLRFNWLENEMRYYGKLPGNRVFAAYLLGITFAFGWTPCIGPILGAILTLSTTSGLISEGTALLSFYSLGLGVPFIVAALFTRQFLQHSKRLKKHGRILQVIAGSILILMGLAMITGYLSNFSIWILKTFPWLGELG